MRPASFMLDQNTIQDSSQYDPPNPAYQYEDNDIRGILKAKVRELNLDVVLPESIIGNYAVSLETYFESILSQEHQKSKLHLIPYNVQGNHWIAVIIKVNDNGLIESIVYLDSLNERNAEIEKRLVELQKKYKELHEFKVFHSAHYLQADLSSCGPLAIENLLCAAQKKPFHKKMISGEDLSKVRSDHIRVYSPFDPSFKKRQFENQNRVVSIGRQMQWHQSAGRLNLHEVARVTEILSVMGSLPSIQEDLLQAFRNPSNENINTHYDRIRKVLVEKLQSRAVTSDSNIRIQYNRFLKNLFSFEGVNVAEEQIRQLNFGLPYEGIILIPETVDADLEKARKLKAALELEQREAAARVKQIETAYLRVELEKTLDQLDGILLEELGNEIQGESNNLLSNINFKTGLLRLYKKYEGRLLKYNPFVYFFEGKPQNLNEAANLNAKIDLTILWQNFKEILRKKIVDLESSQNKKLSVDWTEELFGHFLKLRLVSAPTVKTRAKRVDCQFNEIEQSTLRKLLLSVRDELMLGAIERNSIVIVRKVQGQLTLFRLSMLCKSQGEKSDDEEEMEDTDKKKKREFKRVELEIYSPLFSKDGKNDIKKYRTWEGLDCFQASTLQEKNNTIRNLCANEFLKKDNLIKTQLKCYSLGNVGIVQTVIAYKLLFVLKLEMKRKGVEGDSVFFENRHREYIDQARHDFMKDASVAKAQKGFAYQEHLIMLLAHLAANSKNKHFSIMAETLGPEAWNDVLLKWNEQLIFFQQKHRSQYASSVSEKYTAKALLDKTGKDDIALLKYYRAYQEMKKNFNNQHSSLYQYRDKLSSKNVKFIFFSNRELPINENQMTLTLASPHHNTEKPLSRTYCLEGNANVKFTLVDKQQIPLIDLPGFQNVIANRKVWQIETLPADKLGLATGEQKDLNEFLQLFYLFPGQKDADELLSHCKTVMKTPLGGFGQAFLADTFSHYIHQWFIAEDPGKHVFDYEVIAHFFENHERYHYNLVKYSCYEYPGKEINVLLGKHLEQLKQIRCIQHCIKKIASQNQLTISCQDPLLALAVIQALFPAGERQVITPFSSELRRYQIASGVKYLIVTGGKETEQIAEKVLKEKQELKLIRIRKTEPQQRSDLQVVVSELHFLRNSYQPLAVLKAELDFCLTDLLLFATAELTGGLSLTEQQKYEEQELSSEEMMIPFDQLAAALENKLKHDPNVNAAWYAESEKNRSVCKVEVVLPKFLLGKEIPQSKNPKFHWDKDNKRLYYIYAEKELYSPIPYTECKGGNLNFDKIEVDIDRWIQNTEPFNKSHQDCPEVLKAVYFDLTQPYSKALPNKKWGKSKDAKRLYYFPNGRSRPLSLVWDNKLFSDKRITSIEAEPACGKTWHLKSKINLQEMIETSEVRVLIRIKDIEKVNNMANPLPELLSYSGVSPHLSHMLEQHPAQFHLLLDGFDELSTDFSVKFSEILEIFLRSNHSVTVTVRDYQKDRLHRHTNNIVFQQRLKRFDDKKIESCFVKSLPKDFATRDEKAISEDLKILKSWLSEQEVMSDWLGIPFHVALLSEWYISNRKNLTGNKGPSIAELYDFIIRHRIAKNPNANTHDVQKSLARLSEVQLFGAKNPLKSFPQKKLNFKKDIHFALERTGLLRDPFAKNPELIHRTFAEFMFAKKLARKIVKMAAAKEEVNLEFIQFLVQSENKMILRFFIGVFNAHHVDKDIPYELTRTEEDNFKNGWLRDALGRELLLNTKKEEEESALIWQESPVVAVKDAKSKTNQSKSKNETEMAVDSKVLYENSLKLMVGLFKSPNQCTEISVEMKEAILDWLTNNPFDLGSLKIKSPIDNLINNVFKIAGLCLRLNGGRKIKKGTESEMSDNLKTEVFDLVYFYGDKFSSFIREYKVLLWWRLDDLLDFMIYLKAKNEKQFDTVRDAVLRDFGDSDSIQDEQMLSHSESIADMLEQLKLPNKYFDKTGFKRFLYFCSAIYHHASSQVIRTNLGNFIRQCHIQYFLRNDYPEGSTSLFEKYQNMDEFDIDQVMAAFEEMTSISKRYAWTYRPTPAANSYPFRCWSQGGWVDHDFAMPILEHIGPHLNIIHVFYIRLYVSYAGYRSSDKATLFNIAVTHMNQFHRLSDPRAIFSSLLLFTGLVDDWRSTQDRPSLPIQVAQNILTSFEVLLDSPEIKPRAKLFIMILLVDFINYFDFRGHWLQADNANLTALDHAPRAAQEPMMKLVLISLQNFNLKLNVAQSYAQICLEIYQVLQPKISYMHAIDRMQKLMEVWQNILKAPSQNMRLMLSLPSVEEELLSEIDVADETASLSPSSMLIESEEIEVHSSSSSSSSSSSLVSKPLAFSTRATEFLRGESVSPSPTKGTKRKGGGEPATELDVRGISGPLMTAVTLQAAHHANAAAVPAAASSTTASSQSAVNATAVDAEPNKKKIKSSGNVSL